MKIYDRPYREALKATKEEDVRIGEIVFFYVPAHFEEDRQWFYMDAYNIHKGVFKVLNPGELNAYASVRVRPDRDRMDDIFMQL